jgi:hypothetical protein
VIVTGGIVGEPARELESVSRIEAGRLERVRVQRELPAAALARDRLGRLQQPAAEA